MQTCLYCGAPDTCEGPVHVCVCGRSGNWQHGYEPKLIECGPQFATPNWLRAWRRIKYTAMPVNDPIIADAIARYESGVNGQETQR